MDDEMMKAIEADGEKLRQITGEDHGPDGVPDPAYDLPDDLRVPLHELKADSRYLVGRVAADGSTSGMIVDVFETKLSHVEEAALRINGQRVDLLEALKRIEAICCAAIAGVPSR